VISPPSFDARTEGKKDRRRSNPQLPFATTDPASQLGIRGVEAERVAKRAGT
jgi:hypothetical protein